MANGLWVLVIGLMGPSIPFIIDEFSLDYSQAGLIFTLLSVASFFGTFAGGWVSDYRRRKVFWLMFLLMLAAGLVFFSFAPTYVFLLLTVFVMSLFGSPIGAVGQSIMLQMYPEKRGAYVSLSTMFAAVGSFSAPILISLVYLAGFNWRAAFYITAAIAMVLFLLVLLSRLPQPAANHAGSLSVFRLFGDKRVLFAGLMIFFGVGIDLSFSYWLAEYFISRVGTVAEISGFAVGSFLLGVILGRLLNSRKPEGFSLWFLPRIGLALAAAALVLFLNISDFRLKLVLCFIYGIGVGPIFPSMMSAGTGLYPERSGAVTAVLFSMMSLSGAVFPFMIGSIGTDLGIEKAYYSLLILMVPIAIGLLAGKKIIPGRQK
ncbi:MAG: MFS transporter [Spirochaetales bacterium]|nr:MFS transporter [Spirochaetales bacterium]